MRKAFLAPSLIAAACVLTGASGSVSTASAANFVMPLPKIQSNVAPVNHRRYYWWPGPYYPYPAYGYYVPYYYGPPVVYYPGPRYYPGPAVYGPDGVYVARRRWRAYDGW